MQPALTEKPAATPKNGTDQNAWLKSNIPDMKPMRFANFWKKLNSLAKSPEEFLEIEEYVKTTVEKEGRYNYYFVMYLLDSYR
jgi:hypothetical protein